ncbi:hypothetical protein, partial [Micromonospora yangpuensis]
TAPKPEPKATTLVDSLIARGLLVEFDTEGNLEPVFSRHKLFPSGQGLGSTAEEPHLHRVGLANQPILTLPNDVYMLWSFSSLHSNLWEACTYYVDDSEHVAEGGEPLGLTPQMLANEIAQHLPLLVATGCGYLDQLVQA